MSDDRQPRDDRWNTEADYAGATGEEAAVYAVINWLVKQWRRLRGRISPGAP